ncbi:hypothetical protein ACOME3_010336 [Neoechinorhynchus agilis]
MRLTGWLYESRRISNYLKFVRIPGSVTTGKHRAFPPLTSGLKRHITRKLKMEIRNMQILSNPYVSDKECPSVGKDQSQEITKPYNELDGKGSADLARDRRMAEQLSKINRFSSWE